MTQPADRTAYPDGFLWGASTSAHQIEGNNVASDVWALENRPGSLLTERSGDACDSYHRWREDLDLLAGAGLDAYRFSVEWARVEPTPGQVSKAELAHYRRMVEGCLERGVTPVVTLHHFTSPLWFRQAGGWTGPDAVELFRSYVRAVLPILDGVEWVCTVNEPNMLALLTTLVTNPDVVGRERSELRADELPPPDDATGDALVAAHRAAREELAAVPGLRSGWTVANQVFQPLVSDDAETSARAAAATREWAWSREDRYLDAAKGDDFVGVQSYTRTVVGPDGPLPAPGDAPRTETGWEYYPESIGHALRHTAELVGDTPLLVTENGIATSDDAQRVAYLDGALDAVRGALADGLDVRGYLHWSLLDNFEWGTWDAHFGLVAVDRDTFARTPKPSLAHLGARARAARA